VERHNAPSRAGSFGVTGPEQGRVGRIDSRRIFGIKCARAARWRYAAEIPSDLVAIAGEQSGEAFHALRERWRRLRGRRCGSLLTMQIDRASAVPDRAGSCKTCRF
jgi:hypothetical protein